MHSDVIEKQIWPKVVFQTEHVLKQQERNISAAKIYFKILNQSFYHRSGI